MKKRQEPEQGKEGKAERLARALRENLKKRKAQTKARQAEPGHEQESRDG